MGPRIQMDLPTGLIDPVQGDAQIKIGPEWRDQVQVCGGGVDPN